MSGKVHCWWKKVVWRHQCPHAEGLWYRKKYWLPRVSWTWMCSICPRTAFLPSAASADCDAATINKIVLFLITVIGSAGAFLKHPWLFCCCCYEILEILDALPFINLYQMKNNANWLCPGWKAGGLVWLKSLSACCMHVLLRGLQTSKLVVNRQHQKLWNRWSSRSMAIIFYSRGRDRFP